MNSNEKNYENTKIRRRILDQIISASQQKGGKYRYEVDGFYNHFFIYFFTSYNFALVIKYVIARCLV